MSVRLAKEMVRRPGLTHSSHSFGEAEAYEQTSMVEKDCVKGALVGRLNELAEDGYVAKTSAGTLADSKCRLCQALLVEQRVLIKGSMIRNLIRYAFILSRLSIEVLSAQSANRRGECSALYVKLVQPSAVS